MPKTLERPWRRAAIGAGAAALTIAAFAAAGSAEALDAADAAGTHAAFTKERNISEAHHYAVTMPPGWTLVPVDIAVAHFAEVLGDPAHARRYFDMVFQPEGAAWFTFPYAIAQAIPYEEAGIPAPPDDASMRAFVAGIAGAEVRETLFSLTSAQAREHFAEGVVERPLFNPDRREFGYALRVERPGAEPIIGDVRGFFGRDAAIQLMYYTTASKREEHADTREQLFAGFAFAPEGAYPEVAVPPPAPPRDWRVWSAAAGAALLALIAAGLVLRRARSSRAT